MSLTTLARILMSRLCALKAWKKDGVPGGGVRMASLVMYSSSTSVGRGWSTSSSWSRSGNPRMADT